MIVIACVAVCCVVSCWPITCRFFSYTVALECRTQLLQTHPPRVPHVDPFQEMFLDVDHAERRHTCAVSTHDKRHVRTMCLRTSIARPSANYATLVRPCRPPVQQFPRLHSPQSSVQPVLTLVVVVLTHMHYHPRKMALQPAAPVPPQVLLCHRRVCVPSRLRPAWCRARLSKFLDRGRGLKSEALRRTVVELRSCTPSRKS